MPTWWPWRRSTRQAAPAEPTSPAPEPAAWQHLTPIQRITGDIESTAQFSGFTESLTTSQNPGFTQPVDLLTADHAGLPVLDAVPVRNSSPPQAPAAAPQSHTWAPRVQRFHVSSTAPAQRLTTEDAPNTRVFPVEPTGAESPRDMVEAADVDERRPLDVAPDLSADPPAVVTSGSPAGRQTVQRATITDTASDTVPHTASSTRLPVVQTVPSSAPAVQHSATPPVRHITAVQRTVSALPLPTLPTVDVPAPAPSTGETDSPARATVNDPARTETVAAHLSEPQMTPDTGESLPDPVRTPDLITPAPHSVTVAPTSPAPRRDSPIPAVQRDVSAAGQSDPLPVDSSIHASTRTPDFTPTVRVARLTSPDTTPPPSVFPTSAWSQPDPPSSLPPVSPTHPMTLPQPSTTTPNPAPPVQRSTPSVPAQPRRTIPVQRHVPATPAADLAPEPVRTSPAEPVSPAQPITVATEPHRATPAEPVLAQRLTLPTIDAPAFDRQATPAHTPVQRAVQNRRLVVLPPIHTDSEHPSAPGGTTTTEPETVASSPRPVGLQRMFAAATTPSATNATPPLQRAETTTSRVTPHRAPAESMADDQHFATPTPEHHYGTGSTTITFDTAHLQRESDEPEPPPPPEPVAPEATAVPAAAVAAGAAAPAGPNIDELLDKLYDPLVARLRAELWLDRERAGTLMDLTR